jgi:pimeloyl-ACP methyl ester carboxylesterase
MRVIAVDFPGFGDSEKPSDQRYAYGVAAFADAIADLFGGLGLARAHVLGHGVGGAVALRLSASRPELVKRLALIAPLAHPARAPLQMRPLLAPVVGGLLFRQLAGKSLYIRVYRERINPSVETQDLDGYYEALSSPASRAALLATLRDAQDSRPVIADCRRVRAPTLLIWGRNDRLFPIEYGRYLSREMPHAGLEILNSSHAPHEEVPEDTARVLLDFFGGKRAGSN